MVKPYAANTKLKTSGLDVKMRGVIKAAVRTISMMMALSFFIVASVAASGTQAENAPPKRSINFQLSSPHKSQTYSCNLIKLFSQCREYEVLATAKETLAELSEGCESMGGRFLKKACPADKALASCVDIVRNYHRPDVIYNNFYYTGEPSSWTLSGVARVCEDLGGELIKTDK